MPVMEAGYELDRAVLSKVFDEAHLIRCHQSTGAIDLARKQQFSRDDAAAMRVVDEMVRRGFKFVYYEYVATDTEDVTCLAQFLKMEPGTPTGSTGLGEARNPSRRVAICLAALQAVEGSA